MDKLQSVKRCLGSLGKWLALAVLIGLAAGVSGAAFGLVLNWANAARGRYPWLLYLLPLGGIVIAAAYKAWDENGGSANQALAAARTGEPLKLRCAPMIFASTALTHLLGGSSGREGAALLLGGSLAGRLGKALRLPARDIRLLTMCGMAGAFAAVFGTPVAAAVFTLEVLNVGTMAYGAFLPCLISALVGVWVSGLAGLSPTAFTLQATAALTPANLVRVLLLGALTAGLSVVFCKALHAAPKIYAKYLPNVYLRAAVGGGLIIALTLVLRTTDYNGAGSAVLAAALAGEALPWAFACKLLFTALTLGAGYKGGEIVPIFFTGATFGCVAAPLLGLPAPLGAALGMVALFCACTNAPLASLCLAAEVFGGQELALFALVCAAAWALSGRFGLYGEQRFACGKLPSDAE